VFYIKSVHCHTEYLVNDSADYIKIDPFCGHVNVNVTVILTVLHCCGHANVTVLHCCGHANVTVLHCCGHVNVTVLHYCGHANVSVQHCSGHCHVLHCCGHANVTVLHCCGHVNVIVPHCCGHANVSFLLQSIALLLALLSLLRLFHTFLEAVVKPAKYFGTVALHYSRQG
jgi:hypothetical protein